MKLPVIVLVMNRFVDFKNKIENEFPGLVCIILIIVIAVRLVIWLIVWIIFYLFSSRIYLLFIHWMDLFLYLCY